MKNKLFTLGCLTAVFLVIFAPAALSAADTSWEGTASMSRFGEFPVTGFYGASNSFPRNTIVRVTNVKNGKETTVIVSDRLINSSLFILLSREAAMALDIPQDEVARVKVSVAEAAASAGSIRTAPVERAYSQDPDRNPAAGTLIPESAPVVTTVVPEVTEPPAETPPMENTTALPETPFANQIASGPASANAPILIPMLLPKVPEAPMKTIETPPAVVDNVPEPIIPEETVTASSVSGSPDEVRAIGIVPDMPEVAAEVPLAAEIGGSPAPQTFALETVVMPEQPAEETVEGPPVKEKPSVSELKASPANGETIAAVPISVPEEPAETVEATEGPEIPDATDIAALIPVSAAAPLPLLIEPGVEEPQVLVTTGADTMGAVETVPVETVPVEVGPTAAELAAVNPPETGELTLAALLPDVSAESPEASEKPAAAVMEEGTPAAAETPNLAMADVPPEASPLATELGEESPRGPTPEVSTADMAILNLPEMTEETVPVASAPEVIPEMGPVITEDRVPVVTVTETTGTALAATPAEPKQPEDVTPLAADEVTAGKTGETSLVLTPAEMRPPEPLVKAPAVAEIPPGKEPAAGSPNLPSAAEPRAIAEQPSVTKPAVAAVESSGSKTTETRIALADSLQKGSYYVQLGVYSEAESAKRLADTYSTSFPVSIYKTKEDKYYKVLLGPVNEDETGSLLFNFKKKGFKDAFIRQEK